MYHSEMMSTLPQAPAATTPQLSPLLQAAKGALNAASAVRATEHSHFVEERNVWQPGSWLLQRCWETLAEIGVADEALAVARLAESRHPLAPLQALYRLARQARQRTQLSPAASENRRLLSPTAPAENSGFASNRNLTAVVQVHLERYTDAALQSISPVAGAADSNAALIERLLLIAASAAHAEQLALACTSLERLDQEFIGWPQVVARVEWRTLLAETCAHIGLHPLTTHLVSGAIRRFDDDGALLLHDIAACVTDLGDGAPKRSKRLLLLCVETFEFASLTSLQSRRLAAVTLARARRIDALQAQLSLIANVQDAHREAGLSTYRDEAILVRQVKRPAANPDIDFQVYTLQQAISVLPLRQLTRDQRIALADQLASLAIRSDGWTAAGAATTLIDLGALKYAVEVVDHIASGDPTRAEGMLALVRGLLSVGETSMAAEQAERALAWARSRPDRNPERAITWGLAEAYLAVSAPQPALAWLDQWRQPSGWRARFAHLWRKKLDDDALRLGALRLRGLLQRGSLGDDAISLRAYVQEVQRLSEELRTWAPRLLDGEALILFLRDDLFAPLLCAGNRELAWATIPGMLRALSATSGNRHAAHVASLAALLAGQLRRAALPISAADGSADLTGAAADQADPELHQAVQKLLTDLWRGDAQRGHWQIVHSLEGSFPLLLALEGSTALVALANIAKAQLSLWS